MVAVVVAAAAPHPSGPELELELDQEEGSAVEAAVEVLSAAEAAVAPPLAARPSLGPELRSIFVSPEIVSQPQQAESIIMTSIQRTASKAATLVVDRSASKQGGMVRTGRLPSVPEPVSEPESDAYLTSDAEGHRSSGGRSKSVGRSSGGSLSGRLGSMADMGPIKQQGRRSGRDSVGDLNAAFYQPGDGTESGPATASEPGSDGRHHVVELPETRPLHASHMPAEQDSPAELPDASSPPAKRGLFSKLFRRGKKKSSKSSKRATEVNVVEEQQRACTHRAQAQLARPSTCR